MEKDPNDRKLIKFQQPMKKFAIFLRSLALFDAVSSS